MGGGFHGGGMGGFHGGGFSGSSFHGSAGFGAGGMGGHNGGFREGGFRGERFGDRDHFRNRGFGGFGWDYDSDYYDYPGYYGDYGAYGYSQPYASQYWYYCQYPAGYYPYVSQCSTNWQPVPAG
jgi:hypothetical protein